jgi:hypothetical protein
MGRDDALCVLIIEDGDEYLDALSRFVPGPCYRQAHDAAQALARLVAGGIDLIYLDMRFDRLERGRLVGDLAAALTASNGDEERAWKHLEDNQGLYILAHLAGHGFGSVPVLLSYDFGSEPRRIALLCRTYPNLDWVGDGAGPEEIRRKMAQATGR